MPKVGGEAGERESWILPLGGGGRATFEVRLKKEPRNCDLYFRCTTNFAIRPPSQKKKRDYEPLPSDFGTKILRKKRRRNKDNR